ncbi:nitroreductase family protein [Roseibium polysiphoniae]|uniref:Nitroreductase family protein n=1 Tax=Roseibium polysiphoniae TaxID=2571221 RepID=A0ABR9C6Z0_9HYPH|nr:nitroreductase family protein [Roseibium polysiphoniae]MBD8874672.1 nitroreductase family protein [Roseibium polysiphoniae]
MTIQSTKEFQISDHRTAGHGVDPLFVDRWSPRAFDGSDMPEADLKTILEAARWAPSAFNVQPWRFVYARRADDSWDTLVNLLNPFNKDWAQHASALVFLLSDTQIDGQNGETRPAGTNSFDAGAAWAQAALQASSLGYHTHAMAGILTEDIHQALNVPLRFKAEIAFAIGKRGDAAALAEGLQARELPSPRKPLAEIAFNGTFGA